MAIAFVGHGAWAAGTTSAAPARHASTAAGNMQILAVGCKPFGATINTPNGWNLVAGTDGQNGTTASGIDTGSVRQALFWREFVAGDANPTVSVTSGNVTLAAILSFSKDAGAAWVTPVGAKGTDLTSGTGFSLTMDANPGIVNGDMLVCLGVLPGNNATFGSPTLSATGATIGTVTDNTEGATATGDDLESCTSHAACTAGTASAAPVAGWTLSLAQTGGGAIARLREQVTVTGGLGQLLLTGFAAVLSITEHIIVSAALGVLSLTGFAPTVTASDNQLITSDVGSLNVTGFAPSVNVSDHINIAANTGVLLLTGLESAVNISDHKTVSTGLGELNLTGLVPLVTTTENRIVEPGLGQLNLTGFEPATGTIIPIGTAQIIITGFVPSIINPISVLPGVGSLELTGFDPEINISVTILPGVGNLLLTGFEPLVNVSNDVVIETDRGQLVLSGFVPIVTGGTTGNIVNTGTVIVIHQKQTDPLEEIAEYLNSGSDTVDIILTSANDNLDVILANGETDNVNVDTVAAVEAVQVRQAGGVVIEVQTW